MRKTFQLLIFVTALITTLFLLKIPAEKPEAAELYEIGDKDNPNARAEYEFMVVRDPVKDEIPESIRSRELQLMNSLPTIQQISFLKGNKYRQLAWKEIGPDNVGGRTRAFAADIEHPGVLIAGGVDGGIWKSTDDGNSWIIKTKPEQTHSTSCLVQDVRAFKEHIWYAGTGEIRGSTTNNTRWGSYYHGDGIMKSTNDGETWELLPSTVSGTPGIADDFDFIWNIVVNPISNSLDEVFAATWKGIYRSTDGGKNWTLSKASDAGTINTSTVTTDIAVNYEGVYYAHTRENGVLKIWRSADGANWTSIAPNGFPTSSGRVVIATSASNPEIVYFLIQGPNGNASGHSFWKYTYYPSGGIWEDRSGNLPSDLNTQSGYDQIVHVKPDDPNFVLIGGTNLYRSTGGFATGYSVSVIGGYPYYPDFNHHPDIHGGSFKPTNFNIYYSANDGGIQRTDDINATGMINWVSLNNGYNVTQVYSVAISPDAGDKLVIAGAQDNGSIATDSSGYWRMIYGGDGTVVELPPAADDRIYTQYQSGPMQRQTRAGQDIFSIAPSSATRQLFVNPIALDRNNSNIMYYGGGCTSPDMFSGLWINTDIRNSYSTQGWSFINGSDVGAVSSWTRRVSAIGVSKNNNPNVVYYGTTDGIIKRIDSASSSSPVCSNITPPGLNGGTASGGFVRCIAVDPVDSRRALVAFGNYNFKSLWFTTNSGATWTDVEGNLSGPNGPSIRWATVLYVGSNLNVYLGTSIGLLMTEKLQGESTVWVKAAASEIGNVLIAYMDYRESDRTLVVGTHGRGVFSVQVPDDPGAIDQIEKGKIDFSLNQNYPNPFNPSTSISFNLPEGAYTTVTIYNRLGEKLVTLAEKYFPAGLNSIKWNALGYASGVYLYEVKNGKHRAVKKMILLK